MQVSGRRPAARTVGVHRRLFYGRESLPIGIRMQAPRRCRLRVRTQTSIDTLVRAIGHGNLAIRSSVLRALNSIRNHPPSLDFHQSFVTQQILAEAELLLPAECGARALRRQGYATNRCCADCPNH